MLNEKDWLRKRKLVNDIERFAPWFIWIAIFVFIVGVWFTQWSLGVKVLVFGAWLFLFSVFITYGVREIRRKMDDENDADGDGQ